MSEIRTVLVTGGAGYVGGILVPKLLAAGYAVTVYDLYIYGRAVFDGVRPNPKLTEIQADIRDIARFREAVAGCDAVIHLACISNDPSCDLDPHLTQSINCDAFPPLVDACRDAGVKRFVFASSSSIYGISDAPEVREDHARVPVSGYNRSKAFCEDALAVHAGSMPYVVIRPATVCGYSPRLRLDLTVNILTSHAVNRNQITVFGGSQYRPNLHIQDMTDLYLQLLHESVEAIAGKTYNAGYQNQTVTDIAQAVKRVVEAKRGGEIAIVTTPSDDIRSYRIACDKIERELGFKPRYSIEDAAAELVDAFEAGKIPDALTSTQYVNIKRMQEVDLK